MRLPESLSEIDVYDLETYERTGIPHEQFAYLRKHDPVFWQAKEAPGGPGFWALTKYDDIVHASKHPLVFSSAKGGTNITDYPEENLSLIRLMMVNMDPPQHVKFRNIVRQGFTPRMVQRLESAIRASAESIVEKVVPSGRCDFARDVAAQLPLGVFCELMGVPEVDRPKINAWTNKLVGFDDPEFQTSLEDAMDAAGQTWAYADELAAARRAAGPGGVDLTSRLVEATVDGESLTAMELSSFFLLMMIAGNETVSTASSRGILTLIEHPEAMRKLQSDLTLVESAVEEILRWVTPIIHFRRTLTEDFELRGKKMRAGDKIVLFYPSANRDEDIFPEPQRFDITRNPNPHLTFGIGQHFCMGANLARLQLRVLLETIVRRMPNIALDAPPRWLRSNFVNGIKTMPVRFAATQVANGADERLLAG